ncbi:MAG TPA: type I DNA topoisomerase [Candidatus Saccharimonadales bacterium]|jgi:DNA topoisomerase-1|nr:type I DNA topoisomerase [Candidatus Saccharimonadales bacterium]
MSKNLVIVESPAKAKTIEKYLGKDYTVKSSFGHIRDLPQKGMNIDIEHDFAPNYEINSDKKKVVAELRKAAKEAEDVWLASDEDREGEAIAWHLTQALKLDPKKTKRIVFHEITKTAIEHAIQAPRTVDLHLVDAYQARRVLDRLVGYELSPVLWKKVRTGLSAGRVQSVEVRLVVEREREIREFKPESSFRVIAIFTVGDQELKAELAAKLSDKSTAQAFLEAAAQAIFTVVDIAQKPGSRSPGAPFTTSTLQQEASRRLGFSIKQTMTLAQRLYEAGQITYMRTDSTTLSGLAIKTAEEFIKKNYGDNYHQVRQFKTKNESAQEAHEAIRPTDFSKLSAGADDQQKKLYQLIWQRALASQMAPAQTEKTEVTITLNNRSEKLIAKGEVLKFDGFMKVYGGGKDDTLLPPVNKGDVLGLANMTATETFSRAPARYSEASLVKKLEELGIGRPSTYASTISTIQTRGYIEKRDLEGAERTVQTLTLLHGAITDEPTTEITGADRNKLVPTHLAEVTTDFLLKFFPSIVDYDFTAKAEEDFDKIAEGHEQWEKMIATFYKGFHPLVEQSADISRQEVSQARMLGVDPKTKLPVMARFGRYGPMLQRGETESEEKPTFAPLPTGVRLEDVTLEQALEMFNLPRLVGQTAEGEDIKANIGRFGPYIQIGKIFVSIKPLDPFSITLAEARDLYRAKLEKEANKYIQEFPSGIKVVNGPYGPYITDGKKNAKIPKDVEPAKLTEDECKKLLAEAPARKKFTRRRATKKS